MKLDPSSWYVKWFFWSCGVLDIFTNRYDSEYERNSCAYLKANGTNLCQFMRITLVWTPMVLLLHLVFFGTLIVVLTMQPIHLFGFGIWLKMVIFLALLTGTIIFGTVTANKVRERIRAETTTKKPEPVHVKVKPLHGPSFWEVFLEWILAQKRKVCPLIKFQAYNAQSEKVR